MIKTVSEEDDKFY